MKAIPECPVAPFQPAETSRWQAQIPTVQSHQSRTNGAMHRHPLPDARAGQNTGQMQLGQMPVRTAAEFRGSEQSASHAGAIEIIQQSGRRRTVIRKYLQTENNKQCPLMQLPALGG
ncbi:hypothetical protein D3C71_1386380 [compost metagenome]